MRKIKVVQIGINKWSHAIPVFRTLKSLSDVFEIAGYVLVEDEREKFADLLDTFEGYPELSLEEVLNDPEIDAVIIETEEMHLTKYAIMAAEHGKKIHMEKPGGTDIAEFERLIDTVKRNNVLFHTGYMYRYNPYVMELMQKVKNGELGEIFSIDAEMSCKHSPEVRAWLKDFPGGMMFFLGCHLVDFILQLQGQPENIIPLSRSTGFDGVDAQDFGMTVFEFKNGVSVAKTTSSDIGGYARRHLLVCGSKGSFEIKPLEMFEGDGEDEREFSEKTEYTDHDWGSRGKHERSDDFYRYNGLLEGFAAMVRGERENPYTPDYELELYRTLLKCCHL